MTRQSHPHRDSGNQSSQQKHSYVKSRGWPAHALSQSLSYLTSWAALCWWKEATHNFVKRHLNVLWRIKSTSGKLKIQETNICEKAYVPGTFICSHFSYSQVCEVLRCLQMTKQACVSNKQFCDWNFISLWVQIFIYLKLPISEKNTKMKTFYFIYSRYLITTSELCESISKEP